MGTGVLFRGLSSWSLMLTIPSSAEVKNEWNNASSFLIFLYSVDRDNFTFFTFTFYRYLHLYSVLFGYEKMF